MEDKVSWWITEVLLVAGIVGPLYLAGTDNLQQLQFAAFALWPAIWAAIVFKEMYKKTQAQLDRTQETLDRLRNGEV